MAIKAHAMLAIGLIFAAAPQLALADEPADEIVAEAQAIPDSEDTGANPRVATALAGTVVEALLLEEGDLAIADDELGSQRGGQMLVISNQTMSAVSSGSVINGNYAAGAVSLTDNALSNFNGMGNVLINTGAQNNLQSGMNVTINIVN